MNWNELLKKASVHITALSIFFILASVYMYPVFSGKQIQQHDVVSFKGMAKEIVDHREKYHEEPLWTNTPFSGMPAYQISVYFKYNVLRPVQKVFSLFGFVPVCYIFLCLAGTYIALLILGMNPWLSIAGAIAYTFSTYFFTLLEAGHVSKAMALGYLPPIIAGVYTAFRGKLLLGSLITGIFLGLQLLINHFQITYYTLLIVVFFGIFEFISAVREKRIIEFVKPLPALLGVVILAIGVNFGNFMTTYEYSKYSTRGGSELRQDKGLDQEYTTGWSYGVTESLTLLIPNFKGGASTGMFGENSNSYELMKQNQGAAKARKAIATFPSYWGAQPSTSGPFYVGAAVFFLFILGLFIVKGKIKWWLLTLTVLSVVVSWGHNFQWFNNIMYQYFPGFNKFRDVKMILVIADFTVPFLGILAVHEILTGQHNRKDIMRALKYSTIGLTVFLLFIMLIAGSFNYASVYDEQYRSQGADILVDAFHKDRLALLRADAFRSLVFIIITAAIIFFACIKKLKTNHAILLLGGIILIDMWAVNKRYLNADDFVPKRQYEKPFTASSADMIILQDKDLSYRVLNLTVSPFNDASTSYFHKSIGGYHGAKMARYQDLIEKQIYPNIQNIIGVFNANPTPQALDSVLAQQSVLNMLNTRYIIYNPDAPPLVNNNELGNAWFVNEFLIVNGATEEINALSDIDPAREAVIDKSFEDKLKGLTETNDSTGQIILTDYRANYLKYTAVCSAERLAVFSEIFYDKGWQAYIDGDPADHIRANYVLRAMKIPAGEHTVEFKFYPRSYFVSEKIALVSSILFLLLFAGALWTEWRKKKSTKV
ncbi:MAG: YfhO family protein [Bacteroidales bacterium]|nr:YfhO family protein [Bacteroidales bacterium]